MLFILFFFENGFKRIKNDILAKSTLKSYGCVTFQSNFALEFFSFRNKNVKDNSLTFKMHTSLLEFVCVF